MVETLKAKLYDLKQTSLILLKVEKTKNLLEKYKT